MDALSSTPLKWLFSTCVFEESTLELTVAGRLVELERKPLEVLRHLLRHAGEVVTKEEIHAGVWPGRLLSETVLTKAVSRIREVLGDDSQAVIKTVHGYGYRLIAPVTIEAAVSKAAPVLGLKAGDSPPLRAQWKLAAHLGSGGSGEVWKVVHAKTGDERVYKFALDAEALNTLKREITLFRLLRQQLGPEAPVAEILDWNLEEAPYFLELSYYSAGNLALWSAAQGGLKAIPLATRLAVFADIAAAVAQVHGVGVLHKDLKASNILMDGRGLVARPLLADFGGGGVLADDVISNAGITHMGFSQLLDQAGQVTTLYLAPEVLEGQPQTIRGDVYALGVLLYQLCVGDFRKPVSTGWEYGIEDELLQKDIAEAVQGNPERRLSSAQELADRIRELETRRETLLAQRRAEAEQKAAADEAQLTRRKIEQLRVRRKGLIVALVLLLAGLGASLLLYREARIAQAEAERARAVADAVGNFLNYDVLSATEVEGRDARQLTAQQLLDQAAQKVDERFKDEPEAGARIHSALSSSFMQIGDTAAAVRERGRGWDLARAAFEKDPQAALKLAVDLSPVDFTRDQDAAFWLAAREAAIAEWGPKDERTLLLRNAVALSEARERLPVQAAADFEALVRDAAAIPNYYPETLATHWEDLGQEQAALARFADAEKSYREAIAIYEKLYGPKSFAAVTAQVRFARLLTVQQRDAEAEALLARSLAAAESQRNARNALVNLTVRHFALLRLEQGRFDEAAAMAARSLEAELVARGPRSQQVVFSTGIQALIEERRGRPAEAARLAAEALRLQAEVPVELLYGARRKAWDATLLHAVLARSQALSGQLPAARQTLIRMKSLAEAAGELSPLDRTEPLLATGVVAAAGGDAAGAQAAVAELRMIHARLVGAGLEPRALAVFERRGQLPSLAKAQVRPQ
ncbi:MAG: winged helix-turn-helix domain-containing protein [Pseudomonadota bacterium]